MPTSCAEGCINPSNPSHGLPIMAFDWNNLTAAAKSAIDRITGDDAKQKARDVVAKAGDATAKVKEHADSAAEAAAKKITEWTGRETTAAEVKKAAVDRGFRG